MVGGALAKLAGVALGSAAVTILITDHLGIVSKVQGNSMQPTFNPNCGQLNEELRLLSERKLTRQGIVRELKKRLQRDRVLINKYIVKDAKRKLKIGDVVVFSGPDNPRETLIKRIAAMPGDIIYSIETGETKVIDEGHCWVEGDNLQHSNDSNNFGQVPLELVWGRVEYIIWPPSRIMRIRCEPDISLNSTKTTLISQKQSK